jgi:hypothetical protein
MSIFKTLDIDVGVEKSISVPLDWAWVRKVRIAAELAPVRNRGVRMTVINHNDAFVTALWLPNAPFWEGRALLNDSGWGFFETAEEAWELLTWKNEYLADKTSAAARRAREISRERAALRKEQEQRDLAYHRRYLRSRIIYQPTENRNHNIDIAKEARVEIPRELCREMWRVGIYDVGGELVEEKRYPCPREVVAGTKACLRHRQTRDLYGEIPPTILCALRYPEPLEICSCNESRHEHVHLISPQERPAVDRRLARAVTNLCALGATTFTSCEGDDDDDLVEPAYVGVYDYSAIPAPLKAGLREAGFSIVANNELPSGAGCLLGAFDEELPPEEALRRNRRFCEVLERLSGELLRGVPERTLAEWT